jgi:hypothetical protein
MESRLAFNHCANSATLANASFNGGATAACVSNRTSISASQWGQVTVIVAEAIEKHSSVAAFPLP